MKSSKRAAMVEQAIGSIADDICKVARLMRVKVSGEVLGHIVHPPGRGGDAEAYRLEAMAKALGELAREVELAVCEVDAERSTGEGLVGDVCGSDVKEQACAVGVEESGGVVVEASEAVVKKKRSRKQGV